MRLTQHPALLALLALLPLACRTAEPVHFSSSPPGAVVVIDGQESGFVTPCLIDLPDGPPRTIEFRLPGYQTVKREVRYDSRKELVFWREASGNLDTWNFPLWLNAEDFFIPRKNLSGESPQRLHVRLRREAELGD